MNQHIFWYAHVGWKVPTDNSDAADTAGAETCRNLDRRNPGYILPYFAPKCSGNSAAAQALLSRQFGLLNRFSGRDLTLLSHSERA